MPPHSGSGLGSSLSQWGPCGFQLQILEDYLLVEDVPLLEEMAEEDEELDLYNEMTFGLGKITREPQRQGDQPTPHGARRMEVEG